MPGKNGYVFIVEQDELIGLGCPCRTLRLLSPGPVLCHNPAPGMRCSTHEADKPEVDWAGGGAPAGRLPCDFPQGQGQQQASQVGDRTRPRGAHPCGHLALGNVPWVSQAPRALCPLETRSPSCWPGLLWPWGCQGLCWESRAPAWSRTEQSPEWRLEEQRV